MKKKNKNALKLTIKIIFYFLFWWLVILVAIIKSNNQNNKNTTTPTNKQYQSKSLLTNYEKYFYDIIDSEFSNTYYIMPQVNLASIVNKIKDFPTQYQNELYRNIDIGIFNKSSMTPLLLIEINDKTHNNKNRIARDNKVKEICSIANIPLITFYSNYPNKKDYIIKRIKETLSNNLPNVSDN